MEVGIFMAKYSFEFKKKVVTDYLNGKGGYNTLATKYSIPATSNVKNGLIILTHLVMKV